MVLALVLTVAGCGEGDTSAGTPEGTVTSSAPTATTAPTTTPTTEPTPEPAPETPTTPAPSPPSDTSSTPSTGELAAAKAGRGPVGVWRNRELQWVLRIKKNGRFVDDFAGVKNIRSGKWRLKGKKVILKGGDGVTTRGRLKSKTLTIRGTVLVRVR